MADWLKPKTVGPKIGWKNEERPPPAKDLEILRRLQANELAINAGVNPKAEPAAAAAEGKPNTKSKGQLTPQEALAEFQSWNPNKKTVELPWSTRGGEQLSTEWQQVAVHQKRILGDLADLENKLWDYMKKKQDEDLVRLNALEKREEALFGKPSKGKADASAAKKEEKYSFEPGHYHYVGCVNDSPEKYSVQNCSCSTRMQSHTSDLTTLAEASKGRIRPAGQAFSISSSSSSPSSPSSSSSPQIPPQWQKLEQRQSKVLTSIDSLEEKAWKILERSQQNQLRRLEALERLQTQLEGGKKDNQEGKKANQQKNQGKQQKNQGKQQNNEGKQHGNQQQKKKAEKQPQGQKQQKEGKKQQQQQQQSSSAKPKAVSVSAKNLKNIEYQPFNNKLFESNQVHHLVLAGLPALVQQFPSLANGGAHTIVGWKDLETGEPAQYLVHLTFADGASLHAHLSRPKFNLGRVTVVTGVFSPSSATAASPQPSGGGAGEASSAAAVQAKQEGVAKGRSMSSSAFKIAPSDYYSWTLEQRRDLLQAPSIHYLFKSMIFHNSKADHTDFSDPLFSKYYMVLVQYSASTNNEKLIKAFRAMTEKATGKAISKKKINFRLVPEDVSAELTGFGHNAVSPLGCRSAIPIVLSHKALELDYIWMGGGHVDLKWRMSTKEFIEKFQPLIVDFTNDEQTKELNV